MLRQAGLLDDLVLADTVNAQPEMVGLIAESMSFPKARVVDPLRGLRASGIAASTASASTRAWPSGRSTAAQAAESERLTRVEDVRVELALKTPWRDGTIALRFIPEQFVARLAALFSGRERT